MVLKRFRELNLKVKLSKCVFAAKQVCYLGHVISQQGIAPDPAKTDAVKSILPPSDLKQLRSFLGLTGYYRRFVPQYATVAAPLTQLTTKDQYQNKFSWTEECDKSFTKLKDRFFVAPLCYVTLTLNTRLRKRKLLQYNLAHNIFEFI